MNMATDCCLMYSEVAEKVKNMSAVITWDAAHTVLIIWLKSLMLAIWIFKCKYEYICVADTLNAYMKNNTLPYSHSLTMMKIFSFSLEVEQYFWCSTFMTSWYFSLSLQLLQNIYITSA